MTDTHGTRGRVPRRRWLAVSGTLLGSAFAGCLGGGDNDDDSPDGETQSGAGDNAPDDSTGGQDSGANSGGSPDASLPITLTGFTVADAAADVVPTVIAETEAPLAATLASDTEITRPGTLAVEFIPVDDPRPWAGDTDRAPPEGTPVLTTTEEFNIEPDATQSVTVEGVTRQLADGAYVAVARISAADTLAVAPLTVAGFAELAVDVYTRSPSGTRAEAGELVLASGPVPTRATDDEPPGGPPGDDVTVYQTVDLAEQPAPTLRVPLTADTDTMVVTAREVDRGVYPPAHTEVSLNGATLPDVELVAGYPLQGTDAMRFSMYILERRPQPTYPPYKEWIRYGTYGANGDYNSLYITGSITPDNRLIDSDGTPPAYESDLQKLREKQGLAPPAQSARIDGTGFFYAGTRNRWEVLEESPSGFRRETHIPTLDGVGSVTNPTVGEREYLGSTNYRDHRVDVYRVNTDRTSNSFLFNTDVFVDPATGHVLRIERDPMAEEGRWTESYEVVEFFAHGEPATADLELMKARSKHNTGPNLSELPWEHAAD